MFIYDGKVSRTSIRGLLFTNPPRNGKFYAVAIDGRGGSGKTVFAKYLRTLLPDFVFLDGDDYFEPVENEVVWGKFNDERFETEVIKPIKEGEKMINYRPYNWHADLHITDKTIKIQRGVCIERCFSFAFDLDWDLKIWVEAPKNVCFQRGLKREHMPRDRVLGAWEIWQATEDKYIVQTKPQEAADIVIDGMKQFENQL